MALRLAIDLTIGYPDQFGTVLSILDGNITPQSKQIETTKQQTTTKQPSQINDTIIYQGRDILDLWKNISDPPILQQNQDNIAIQHDKEQSESNTMVHIKKQYMY